MKYTDIQASGKVLKMSKFVFGGCSLTPMGNIENAFRALDRYMELGGNTIDTARVYGGFESFDNEDIIGKWISSRRNRDKIILVTKGAHPPIGDMHSSRLSRECIFSDIDTSLRKLGVECVDIYFLHRDDPNMSVGEIIDTLDILVKQGKTKAIGASNWTADRIAQANEYALKNNKTPFTVSQIQWSLLKMTPRDMNDDTLVCMNREEYEKYLKINVPVMAYSSQAKGRLSKAVGKDYKVDSDYITKAGLSDKTELIQTVASVAQRLNTTPAAVSLAYITSNKFPASAIIGFSVLAQLEDSMSDPDLSLSEEDFCLFNNK